MKQPLTWSLWVIAIITALFVGFVAGRVIGQNAFNFAGISGKTLLYLTNIEVVESLNLGVNLRGTVAQKEQDAILVRRGDSPGVWATFQESTVFEEAPLTEDQPLKELKLDDINVGDSVVVLGDVEGDSIQADVVIRQPSQ